MVRRQRQQSKQQQSSKDNENGNSTRGCASHGFGISQTDIGNCIDEPQTPFTLLPSSHDKNASLHSTAFVVAAADEDDVVTSKRMQRQEIHRDDTTTPTCNNIDDGQRVKRNAIDIPERTKWGPSLSLPDIDDVSMNYTFLYMEHYKVDLLWSMISDFFFILGGISYIVLSGWDYHIYQKNISNDDDNNNKWYIAVDLIAPTVYLVNSIIDIRWAEAVRLRLLNKQDMTKIWDEARFQLRGISFTSSSLSSTFDYSGEVDVQSCCGCTWCYRIRKYAAHRRTMVAAFCFGIAASLAVIAAVLRNFFVPNFQSEYGTVHTISPWVYSADSILDALSDHVYILSAIFSMTGKRHRPWLSTSDPNISLYNDSERLEDLGDLLFLIGSLVDSTLTDLQLKHLVLLPIFSSVLWMVDGCLYMRSDIVKASKLRDEATASKSDVHPIKFIV